MKSKSPPVFIMNMHYTGIGIARNLQEDRVEVFGLSSQKSEPGRRSRYLAKVYDVPDGRDAPEALCRELIDIRKGHSGRPLIFPTRDLDVLFLHRYVEILSPHFLIPQPKGDVILRVLDKNEVATVARDLSIPVPRTYLSSSYGHDFEDAFTNVQFPVVVKPRFAYQWRQKGAWEKVGGEKAVFVENMDLLRDECRRLTPVTEEVLIQEYINGSDKDIAVFCCFIDRGGELKGYFTARKLCQNPPLFGTGCLVEALDIPGIIQPSVILLKKLGYTGIAEIEYKFDRDKGQYFLIEINPRHWDQHELGVSAGINLTRMAFRDAAGLEVKAQKPSYDKTAKWIAERELFFLFTKKTYAELNEYKKSEHSSIIRYFVEVVKNNLKELSTALHGHRMYAVMDLRDPLPGFILLWRTAYELIRIGLKKALLPFMPTMKKVERH